MIPDCDSSQLDLVDAVLLDKNGHVIAIGRARVTGGEAKFFDGRAAEIETPAMIVFKDDEIFTVTGFMLETPLANGNRYRISMVPYPCGF
jgi:hypothetical protein